MSKLSKGLTITAVTAALAGGIGFAYAQSSGQGAAGATDSTGTMSTPSASGMSNDGTTADRINRSPVAPKGPINNTSSQDMSTDGTTNSTTENRLNRGPAGPNGTVNATDGGANDGLNNMPATGAGNSESAAPVMSPERPPRADRN